MGIPAIGGFVLLLARGVVRLTSARQTARTGGFPDHRKHSFDKPGARSRREFARRLFFRGQLLGIADHDLVYIDSQRPADRLREVREEQGLTQIELAARMCVSKPSVSELERGELDRLAWRPSHVEVGAGTDDHRMIIG